MTPTGRELLLLAAFRAGVSAPEMAARFGYTSAHDALSIVQGLLLAERLPRPVGSSGHVCLPSALQRTNSPGCVAFVAGAEFHESADAQAGAT